MRGLQSAGRDSARLRTSHSRGEEIAVTEARAATGSVDRYRWSVVRILFAVAVVLYVDRINITIAAPYLAEEFSLTPLRLGRVLSSFLFGYAAGLAPGGY